MHLESGQLPLDIELFENTRFDNYIVGGNQHAIKALKTILRQSGSIYMALYGQSGIGKTHLLQALCQQAGVDGLSGMYVPLSDVLSYGAEVLCDLSYLDLICIDSLDVVVGHAEWEAAIFNLYNELQANGHKLVVAARQSPSQLGWHLPDLASRLKSGLAFELTPLDDNARFELIMAKAKEAGMSISDQVAWYILHNFSRGMCDLMALMHTLKQASVIEQRKLTIPFVKEVMAKQA